MAADDNDTATLRERVSDLANLWSPTRFARSDLSSYAERLMLGYTRKGASVLGLVSLLLLSSAALVYALLGFNSIYVYTCALLAVLALHLALSVRTIQEIRVLHLLSMTLLVISGTAFVLIAHKTGSLNVALFASVVLLFMVVPLVPWGLREATTVVLLIYLVVTLSTLSVQGRFDHQGLWLLQFLMLGAGFSTLSVIALSVDTRRHDIVTRYALEGAHRRMELLSLKDPLTGAWNRRFLDRHFARILADFRESRQPLHFALIDLDDFKQLNDTHGHHYGDLVLQRLVAAFAAQVGDQGYLIRMGGDEFMLLFQAPDPVTTIKRATAALQFDPEPMLAPDQGQVQVQVSTGLVTSDPGRSLQIDVLYREADRALYQAKSRHGLMIGDSHLVARTKGGPSLARAG